MKCGLELMGDGGAGDEARRQDKQRSDWDTGAEEMALGQDS